MLAWIPDVIAAALVVWLIVSLAIIWHARRRSDDRLRQMDRRITEVAALFRPCQVRVLRPDDADVYASLRVVGGVVVVVHQSGHWASDPVVVMESVMVARPFDKGQRDAVSSADKTPGSHGRTVLRFCRPVTCGNAGGRYWD